MQRLGRGQARGAEGRGKRCLAYLSLPLALASAFAAIFISYYAQPYGNLPDAPAVTANLGNIQWSLGVAPEDAPAGAEVYRAGRLDKAAGDRLLYGTLSCRLRLEGGKTVMDRVNCDMAALLPYKEEPVITPAQAVDELRNGRSFEGAMLEYSGAEAIKSLSCDLDWRAGTKGFCQPAYRFQLQIAGKEPVTDHVPALMDQSEFQEPP